MAVEEGKDSGSTTACPPWVFPCEDSLLYYTKLIPRCREHARFRESEYMTAGIGALLDAPVPRAAAVFVDARIASAPGLGVPEQWGVGLQQLSADPFAGPDFPAFVRAVGVDQRLRIVAVHTWLEISDHDTNGHNFLRGGSDLYSIDHCTALSRILGDVEAPAAPVVLTDPGSLLDGIAANEPARERLKERILSIRREQIEQITGLFPDDPVHPWISEEHRARLVDWIIARQGDTASAIAS
jgi:hypothetical protein